jgi:hypothetical protein
MIAKTAKEAIRRLAAASLVVATTPFFALAGQLDDSQATPAEAGVEASARDTDAEQSEGNAEQLDTAVVEISRAESDGLVSARVSNAVLGDVVAAAEQALGIEIVLSSQTLADEPVANVRFTDEAMGLAIRDLFRGFAHVYFVEPTGGQKIVKVYSVIDRLKEWSTTTPAPVPKTAVSTTRSVQAGGPTNLEALHSLKDLEEEAAALAASAHVDGLSVLDSDEFEEALRIEEEAEAHRRLRTARTERAVVALKSEHGDKLKADAVSELVDAEDTKATDALIAAAENESLSAPLRQHAIETLVNRGAEDGFADPRIIELLSALSQDATNEMSATAGRLLLPVQRELAKPAKAQ